MREPEFTCSFTGHRPEKLPWGRNEGDARCIRLKERIHEAVRDAAVDGYSHFLCGMARGCDLYFAEEILLLKIRDPSVTLEAVVPCVTQSDGWRVDEIQRYRRILLQADYTTLIQEEYSNGCMQRRNRYMVDHSSRLIAVGGEERGGTYNTMLYAMKHGVPVVSLDLPQ